MHRWVRPPPESGGGRAQVGRKYSIFLIRKNRYLVTLARVSPRRNNRSRAQTSIFAIENRTLSGLLHQGTKAAKVWNHAIRIVFSVFLLSCSVHRDMKNSKNIHFLLIFSVFLFSCIRARKQKKYESHSFPVFVQYFCFSGPGTLDFGIWTFGFGLWILDFGLWI